MTARGGGAPPLRAVAGGPGLRVTLRGLARSFGPRVVLDGVDLEVAPGEFVALVGRSGCGKSTLLRIIAGLEAAERGSLALDGVARAGLAPDVRLVFQEPRLLPWRTVFANVALGLPTAGRRRAEEALRAVGLLDRAGDRPAVLSGGQRQRVALARALVHEPRLLLLDEPLGALDALTRIEMQGLIERLWRERGFTAILVTHDVAEAVALADRVILLDGGRVASQQVIRLARPRPRGGAEVGALQERILAEVFRPSGPPAATSGERDERLASVAARSRRTLQAIRERLRERKGESA